MTSFQNAGSDAVAKKGQFIVPGVSTYYETPIVASHGEGPYLYDVNGNKYLDFFGGILTVSLGHAHSRVNAAVHRQIDKLVHTSTLYITEPMVELAETLARLTPEGLEMSFFTSSGTEANETAIAMARMATGNFEVIALRHGYSGRSSLAMTLTGQAPWRLGQPGLPGIVHAKNPYFYRSSLPVTEEQYIQSCLEDLEETIVTATSGRIAAILAEPIQGVGGFITLPDGYLKEVARIAHKYGGLLIVDEVQTGFGRTGKWFGVEHHNVAPDIMTFAKGMANGFPIGATIATQEVGKAYGGPTISTFGGNPVTMCAALETLAVIEEDHLVDNARIQGQRLREGLKRLQERYYIIGDVRGKGLMQGFEFVRDDKEPAADLATAFLEETKRQNLLVGKGGLYGNSIRIAPMLTVSSELIDAGLEAMGRAMEAVSKL